MKSTVKLIISQTQPIKMIQIIVSQYKILALDKSR